MKRRMIGLFLALLMLVCVPALADEAQWSYDSGNMCLEPSGTLSGDVTIPAEVDGYPVNAIRYNAFNSNQDITSLTMPDTLRALQSGAISWMDGLTSVTLNDGLEYIGSNFRNCNALTTLTIPASVRIVDGAIGSCANLKEITFEGACPLFLNPSWCFDWLSDGYVIYVPDDQLDAYAQALEDANGAAEHLQPSGKNAVIPETASKEDWFAFDAATGTITGYKEYYAYVEIPASIGGVAVKAIGEKAFASDYSVYGVIFPEGVERVDAGAFQYASNICYAQFPSTLKTIGDDAFFNAQIDRIDWNEGLEEIGARAFQYGKESILTLPTTVKTIGESAFEGSWCQELYLSDNVESIGARAFANTGLNYLAFDFYEMIDIAPDAFADNSVADLDLPWDSSIENRDAYAALLKDQCPDCTVWINNPINGGVAEFPTNETEITTIENGVWKVYNGDQKDLTVWTDYDDIEVTALGEGVFKGNQTIRSFYPHHCGWFQTIGKEAFADSSVEYVEMFPSITTIDDEAFRNCANITEITLPESLTTLGAGAFRGCTGITELILPASLTSVGEGALDGCEKLARLVVLCDPAILPENLLAECFAHTEIYAAPDATNEQVRLLSKLAQRPWYVPVSRVGEPVNDLVEMPYAMLPGDDFWYDEEYCRLDNYMGYELNLALPREIDGVQLTMIGGNMMSRACYGDNFDVELPVRSLVIPETYTEIPSYAFWNCDTLETVICYAPIENLAEGVFAGCTSLREVIFVNGVRNVDGYVFSDCPSLETVYLGAYTESVSEKAFMGEYDVEYFKLEDCITDPALMPDVDALLEAVKSDPMPEPTPAPTLEPARPVGAEGADFIGEWYGVTMESEGMTFSLSDFGIVMVLTLNEDGTATLYDGEETEATVWKIEDGVAIVDTMQGSIDADGTLCLEVDSEKVYFTRDGEATGATSGEGDGLSAEPVGAEGADFIGEWYGVTMESEGMTFSLSDFGIVMVLTLNEDGTATLYDGEETEATVWKVEDGMAIVDTMQGSIDADGTLCLDEDGEKIYFTRDGEATGAASGEGDGLSAEPVGAEGADFIGEWYGVTMESEGMTFSLSDFGIVMVLTLNEDGTATLFDGEETDETVWTVEDGMAIVDDVQGSLQEDGTLCLDEDGDKIYFTRDGEATGAAQGETEKPDSSTDSSFVTDAAGSDVMQDRLERKFVCINADVEGYLIDAAMLGGEYSVTFHEDGTVDFVLVGEPLPSLAWTQGTVETESGEADAYLVDYYGNALNAVWTEEGFDMNYFDAMLMHFVPAE